MESTETILSLTPAAVEKVESFIEEHGAAKDAGIRVAVLPGGCSGFQYGLNIEDEPEADDEILELSGVRIFVDPFSVQYLEGVEVDPEQFYIPKYIGPKGWVGVRLDLRRVDWEAVKQLLWESYRLQAPKRLARKLERA